MLTTQDPAKTMDLTAMREKENVNYAQKKGHVTATKSMRINTNDATQIPRGDERGEAQHTEKPPLAWIIPYTTVAMLLITNRTKMI